MCSELGHTWDLPKACALDFAGLVTNDMNQPGQALSSFQAALELRETHMAHAHSMIAANLNKLAITYMLAGNLESSYEYFQKAISTFTDEVHAVLFDTYFGLSILYVKLGRLDEAEETYQKALSYQNSGHSIRTSVSLSTVLFRIRAGQDRLGEALELAWEVFETRKDLLDFGLRACDALYQVAMLQIKLKRHEKATQAFLSRYNSVNRY
jgi:tetratricopeptide (TPR) repeat protein